MPDLPGFATCGAGVGGLFRVSPLLPANVTLRDSPRTLTAIGIDPAITGEPREEPPTVRSRARAQ